MINHATAAKRKAIPAACHFSGAAATMITTDILIHVGRFSIVSPLVFDFLGAKHVCAVPRISLPNHLPLKP